MEHVPRIEVHPWNNQPLINPCSNDIDDSDDDYENIPPFDYTPVHSTLLDEQPRHQPTLAYTPSKNKPKDAGRQQSTRQASHFWSRLKRSKSDHGCYCLPDDNCPSPLFFGHERPQPAMRGGRLFWSSEQQMWLFERQQHDDSPSSHHSRHFRFHRHHHHHDKGATKLMKQNENRRRALSATTPRRRACANSGGSSDDDDNELLSAQLPGHYSLSVYDYAGNGSSDHRQQSCNSSDGLLMPAEGPWISVASKMLNRDPLR